MQDVLIKADTDGLYDLVIEDSDFASAEGFESSLPVSYFTDARASAVQVQEARNRRGWVGNLLKIDTGHELGGLLWILDQARLTEDTLNFGRSYAQGSLQWMLDDSIARQITITTEKTGERAINILTDITTIDNTVTRYVTLWRNTNFERIL